jgi:FMN hydrolase / 5-amino-6-(5-phospho-D-ribitylamino)uracil phosphatase
MRPADEPHLSALRRYAVVPAPLSLAGAPVRAVTLDLDDTLWPFGPVAVQVQSVLDAWLAEHAPATAARYDQAAAFEAVAAVRRENPHLAHDVSATRKAVLAHMLESCGEDPALAEPAFAVVYDARQRVTLYPEVPEAMDRLAARVPLLAVTNGNADLELTGVARWFTGIVAPHDVGVTKPDPAIYRVACERLGLPCEDIVHAGDDLALDVRGALDAGLRAAWVHRDEAGDTPDGVLRVRDLAALADALGA